MSNFIEKLFGLDKRTLKKYDRQARKVEALAETMRALSDDEIWKVDSSFDKVKFNTEAFNLYKELQTAWMNFDYDTIRELVSDEMYNMYSMYTSKYNYYLSHLL